MKKKLVPVILIALAAVLAVAYIQRQDQTGTGRTSSPATSSTSTEATAPRAHSHQTVARVPAHMESKPSLASLAPTLAAEQFEGKAREAYRVVREIPQTIAQLPCYCHCDESFGHKSLHTCFEDDHAAHCAVCVDEALMAYYLEKQEKLTPAQVRERIIATYSGS